MRRRITNISNPIGLRATERHPSLRSITVIEMRRSYYMYSSLFTKMVAEIKQKLSLSLYTKSVVPLTTTPVVCNKNGEKMVNNETTSFEDQTYSCI